MKTFVSILSLAAMLVAPQMARANKKTVTLPASVLASRTIYVDNQTTEADLLDGVLLELAKWGRFQIVDQPQKAELVLRLNNSNSVKVVPEGAEPSGFGARRGNAMFSSTDEEASTPSGYTRATLIDSKTGNAVWSDLRKTSGAKLATRLLDALRDVIEQQQKRVDKL